MYKLLIKRSAESDLRRLPYWVFQRVNQQILALPNDPRPAGVRKLKGNIEGWHLRVGDYRILYQIDDAAQTITIIRVKHRREAYG